MPQRFRLLSLAPFKHNQSQFISCYTKPDKQLTIDYLRDSEIYKELPGSRRQHCVRLLPLRTTNLERNIRHVQVEPQRRQL